MSDRIRRIIFILAVLFVCATILPSSRVYADDTDDIQESIKEKQAQIEAAEKEKKQIQSQLSDVKKVVNDLKSTKKNLEAYVSELDNNLVDVQEKINELKGLISEKEDQILEAEADLEEAEEIRQNQYDAMKKRIKFMYEKGDNFFLDMIFASGSFAEMLNKADYAEMLSEYDSDKLQEFKETCEYIEACKEELEADKEVLDEAKAKVDEEEANLQTLIDAKEAEISSTSASISSKEAAAKEIEADLAEQTAIITALEKAVAEEKAKLGGGSNLTYDGGMFKWPCPNYVRISDDYGWRTHPILGSQQFHSGLDMAAAGGSPILAAYDGEVSSTGYNSSMGNYVMINHGGGLYTIYMHCSAIYTSQGAYVARGEKIAAVGTTGRSTGNHLHFSVRLNGSYVNPWGYLK